MKKKFRDITVNGKLYGWQVKGGNQIVIWYDKKVIHTEVISYSEIPNLGITPKLIADKINSLATIV